MNHNNNEDWLTRFLFSHIRMTRPDGRPLYAYKCEENKYIELKELLIRQLSDFDKRGEPKTQFPYFFCLYAAETFCREHSEGQWKWETVFKPLGMECPSLQNNVYVWVEKGLEWWKRPLIRGQNGNREFLDTIACEGGLPLRLLQHENTKVNQFFRAVLERNHAQGGNVENVEANARLEASYLPPNLRQPMVFRLTGELIAAVVALQRNIGTVANPIAALDATLPDWRKNLPLRLEEQTAEALFNGLVKRAQELSRADSVRLRWRGKVKQTAYGWRVEKCLELPETVSGIQIKAWLKGQEPKARLRLLVNTPAGSEAVAWLTLTQGSGDMARYRREWLRRGGLVLTGKPILEPHTLSLHDGQNDYSLTVQDGDVWDEVPWVFVKRDTMGEWEWLGEGSVRTRVEHALVLAATTLDYHADGTGGCERLGILPELQRTIYQIGGTVDFLTAEQDRYRIVCQAELDSSATFTIVGDTLIEALNAQPIYRGLPRIVEAQNPPDRMQWRPMLEGGMWRDFGYDCAGRVWLRLTNAMSGVERFRRQVDVLPRTFRIESTIGLDTTKGEYRFYGLAGGSLHIDPNIAASTGMTVDALGDCTAIRCPVLQTHSLPKLIVSLLWPSGKVELCLPYPQRGAVFQLAGQLLQRNDCIPLARIGGLRLILQDQAGGKRFWLDGEFIAQENGNGKTFRLGFRDRLPLVVEGRCETTLLPWQERIASLLASSRDLDAHLRLEIRTTQGECLAKLQIARFDARIEPHRDAGQVRIPGESLARLGDEWQQRIRLEMFPLWSPGRSPVALEINPEHQACWNVPTGLELGPWWIVGRDGDWARFRPLLWDVTTVDVSIEQLAIDSALAAAIREPNTERREHLFAELLPELGQNPEHPDWPKLFALIRLVREYPPSSLDVLTRLISHPKTLALALLKADDEMFDCVWALAEQMPFSWGLLPVDYWRNAALLHFQGLQKALGEIDANGSIVFGEFQRFRERASARRDYWQPLCDWLQEFLFPQKPILSEDIQRARTTPHCMDALVSLAEKGLQTRHDAEEQEKWPRSGELEWLFGIIPQEKFRYAYFSPENRSVRCAPFIAANICLQGILSSNRQLYELRLLRALDTEWFDTVYAIALTIGLAQLPKETDA